MGIKLNCWNPGLEDLSCDKCGEKNEIEPIVVLCVHCSKQLRDISEKHNIEFSFEMKEVE